MFSVPNRISENYKTEVSSEKKVVQLTSKTVRNLRTENIDLPSHVIRNSDFSSRNEHNALVSTVEINRNQFLETRISIYVTVFETVRDCAFCSKERNSSKERACFFIDRIQHFGEIKFINSGKISVSASGSLRWFILCVSEPGCPSN